MFFLIRSSLLHLLIPKCNIPLIPILYNYTTFRAILNYFLLRSGLGSGGNRRNIYHAFFRQTYILSTLIPLCCRLYSLVHKYKIYNCIINNSSNHKCSALYVNHAASSLMPEVVVTCKMFVNLLKFPAKTAKIIKNARRCGYDLVRGRRFQHPRH